MNPAVSIIVPLYNKRNHIRTTLESALAQTFRNFELIVVNDGSTDDGESQVLKLEDHRIRYVKTENQGVSAARNHGISLALASLIAFLDADDLWRPEHLEHLIALHRDFPGCGMYATNYEMYHSTARTVRPHFNGLPDFPWRGIVPDYFASSYVDRIAWTSALLIPREILEDVGTFRTDITLGAGEDLDLWTRIGIRYPVAFDSRISARHNLSADNRLSLTQTQRRQFTLLDDFRTQEARNPSLKRFLDLYRSEFALKMKLAGDARYRFYTAAYDPENLSTKTKFLLSLPRPVLVVLYGVKKVMERWNMRISAYH